MWGDQTGSLGRLITKPHKNFEYYPRYDEWVLIFNFLIIYIHAYVCGAQRSQKSLDPEELELQAVLRHPILVVGTFQDSS